MVGVRSLQRITIPPGLLSSPSPASIHSNRVAVQVLDNAMCYVYFASGSCVYRVKVVLDDQPVIKGKESLLIPTDIEIAEIEQLDFIPHRAEIQNLSISEPAYDGSTLLGSVDSYGRLMVTYLGLVEKGATYFTGPQDAGIGEGGWAGLSFNPGQQSMVVVARSLAKSIDVYDADMHVRTLHTLQHPTGLTFLKGPFFDQGKSSILAVTEGSQLSIWDLRTSERAGCVQRVVGSSSGEPLYAICSCSAGYVGAGGAERSAIIFDSLKWASLSQWTNCLKYEVTGMTFSAVDPTLLYVHGLDYEVVCGRWNTESHASKQRCFAFRGDSRWLGFSKCPVSDVLAGWCELGSIFAGVIVSENDM